MQEETLAALNSLSATAGRTQLIWTDVILVSAKYLKALKSLDCDPSGDLIEKIVIVDTEEKGKDNYVADVSVNTNMYRMKYFCKNIIICAYLKKSPIFKSLINFLNTLE